VRDTLEAQFGAAEDARLDWKPQNTVVVDEDTASTLLMLLDSFDDNDDVQHVAANFEVDDAILERLSA
jgi:transcriptional/translational regulatory protein YebC/TACO1